MEVSCFVCSSWADELFKISAQPSLSSGSFLNSFCQTLEIDESLREDLNAASLCVNCILFINKGSSLLKNFFDAQKELRDFKLSLHDKIVKGQEAAILPELGPLTTEIRMMVESSSHYKFRNKIIKEMQRSHWHMSEGFENSVMRTSLNLNPNSSFLNENRQQSTGRIYTPDVEMREEGEEIHSSNDVPSQMLVMIPVAENANGYEAPSSSTRRSSHHYERDENEEIITSTSFCTLPAPSPQKTPSYLKAKLSPKYSCPLGCTQGFLFGSALNAHMKKDHGMKELKERCLYCSTFHTNLAHHIRNKHADLPFISSEIYEDLNCKGIGEAKFNFLEMNKTQKVKCQRCAFQAKSLLALFSHALSHHKLNKAFVCRLCPKVKIFSKFSILSKHLLAHIEFKGTENEDGDKISNLVACRICGAMKKLGKLPAHLKKHEELGEDLPFPYPCAFCSSKFETEDKRDFHTGVKHDDEEEA